MKHVREDSPFLYLFWVCATRDSQFCCFMYTETLTSHNVGFKPSIFAIVNMMSHFYLLDYPLIPIKYLDLVCYTQTIVILLAGGCGAATTYAQVGKYGNSHAGWMPICDNFGKFCHKVLYSLILGYITAFCYVLLAIISANKARKIPV